MKKISIILFALGFYPIVWSQNINERYAATIAQKYMQLIFQKQCIIDSITPHFSDDTLCYYNVYFEDSLYCIVSAYKSAPPILAHGFISPNIDSVNNESYLRLIHSYERHLKKLSSQNRNALENPIWDSLLTRNRSNTSLQVLPLLDNARNQPLRWGQKGNNTNFSDCEPAYNQECPWVPFSDCNLAQAGCGPVAMGQIMWYWQWPRSSEYRTYHWENMPTSITRQTEASKAKAIAQLLRDCGRAANSMYTDVGTATRIGYLFPALRDDFGYNAITLQQKFLWQYRNAWEDLLKSELDNKRPILYYGDDGYETHGHYFILDGYYELYGETKYHINWGHKGVNNGYFTLDNFIDDDDEYLLNNKAIVGISPTYNEYDINNLNYSIVPTNHTRKEYAYHNITIPSTSNSLTVESGGELLFEAGNEIELLPGFEAEYGSDVEVRINTTWQSQMAISLVDYPSAFPAGSELTISTKNADSWEFYIGKYIIYENNLIFIPIIETAGSIRNDNPIVWDGGETIDDTYYCWITLKNSFGRVLSTLFEISSDGIMNYLSTGNQSNLNNTQMMLASPIKPSDTDSTDIQIYPNPSNGIVEIEIPTDSIISIDVFNTQGQHVYTDNNIINYYYTLNLSYFPKGNYILYIQGRKKSYSKTVIKQ